MTNDDTYIPGRLDDSWKIGLWDLDVAFPVLFFLYLGWIAGSRLAFCICLATGIYLSRKLSKLKVDRHEAFALHWMHWMLPATPLTHLRETPPAYIQRMIG